MEMPCLNCLFDSISQLRSLSSKNKIASDLAQRYFKDIDEMLKHLKTVLDEITSSGIALDEQLISLFEELSLFTNEACELMKSWKRITSKIYMVIQIESVILKIQGSILEACSLLNSLLQSPGIHLDSQCIQQCIQKIQNMNCIKISDAIKEIMRDQIKNRRPEAGHLVQIAESLSLLTSHELLMEAVMLDKLRITSEHNENHGEVEYINHMIALITYMHDRYVEKCRRQSINNVLIPADYCCPLSLELMSDPVIVASGQTFERVFIRKWLDQDINVCPKTRQMLAHTNLIPNYTVKQLIAHWCEKNSIKIPDPSKLFDVKCSSDYLVDADPKANYSSIRQQGLSVSNRISEVPNGSYHEADLNVTSTSPSDSLFSSLLVAANASEPDIDRVSKINTRVKDSESCLEKDHVESRGLNPDEPNNVPQAREDQLQAHYRSAFSLGSSHSNSSQSNGNLTNSMTPDSSRPSTPHKESVGSQPRSTTIWQNHPERSLFRTASTPSGESRPTSLGIESQVHNLIEDLKSESVDVQRDATSQLRLLAKNSNENRIVIATCGAISSLIALLQSSDLKTQEHAVTALLNLSINDNNKAVIVNAGSVDPLIHVLRTGNPESKENAAATLFSLSVMEEHKIKIGRSGAVRPLVDLLANGTPRGKKDAATALFNLSICHENKGRIVQAGAVRHLVDLMDPAAGMVDKAVAVLANLSTTAEGRTAIAHEGGIPCLVEVVELGTARGKENAAAALLQLCNNSNRFCSMVLQEGAVPPLVALSQSGTARAKEKAQSLLSVFKNHRYGRAGRQ